MFEHVCKKKTQDNDCIVNGAFDENLMMKKWCLEINLVIFMMWYLSTGL